MITITGYSGNSAIISLPTTISGVRVSAIGISAFKSKSITNVTGDSILGIGGNAFYSCSNLLIASFPRCTFLGSYAFNKCSALTTITAPEVTYLSQAVFGYCSSLQSINFPNCSSTEYTGGYAVGQFVECTSLSEVNLPKLGYVQEYMFAQCINLSSITLTSCRNVGGCAFSCCSTLPSINLPNCSRLNSSAFAFCTNLQSISIPICSYIYGDVFNGTSFVNNQYATKGYADISNSLNNYLLHLSKSYSTLGGSTTFETSHTFVCDYAFSVYNLSNYILEISLPECSYVGHAAFEGMYSVSTITLGRCLSIDNYAFYNCIKLSTLNLPNTSICSIVGDGAFTGTGITSSTGTIYVPQALLTTYQNHDNWRSYSTRFSAMIPEDAWDTNPYTGNTIFNEGYIVY